MADGGLLAEARIPTREELDGGNKRRQLLVGAAKPPAKPVEITDKRSWGTLHQNLQVILSFAEYGTPPDRPICSYHELQSASLATIF